MWELWKRACLLRRLRNDCRGCLAMPRFSATPERPGSTKYALRHEQRDEHEQSAERKEPILGKRTGEPRLARIDHNRAEDRSRQRTAPSHRDPDHGLDRVRGGKLAWIDDA